MNTSEEPASARKVANQAKPTNTITVPSRFSGRWRRAIRPLPM
ncbi:MAG TPA: hypothetical protein VF101_02990 [Gaiellaceae bacterium]